MKYALIIPDGAADEPQESLGGKTPLEVADLPAMDAVAAAGIVGQAFHVPEHLPAGSDVANLSLLGYDPTVDYTGRAPLEAAAQGIALGEHDSAVRCNLVTIKDQTMHDFTAGHISTDEAAALMAACQNQFASDRWEFHPGVGYRNLLVHRGGDTTPFSSDTRTTPPHDVTDRSVLDDYPRGPGSDLLNQLMADSVALFAEHPVNASRRTAGKPVATNVWLWGLGGAPNLESFDLRYGKRGAMITAVDLLRGLAKLIGWRCIDVAGATGFTDTDYAAKGRHAVEALDEFDLVVVHVEAPDEASHQGDCQGKIESIEQIDRHVVAPLAEALETRGRGRILVSPDHPTNLRTKTHGHGPVPWAMAGHGIDPDAATHYDDITAERSGRIFQEGWRLMQRFLEVE